MWFRCVCVFFSCIVIHRHFNLAKHIHMRWGGGWVQPGFLQYPVFLSDMLKNNHMENIPDIKSTAKSTDILYWNLLDWALTSNWINNKAPVTKKEEEKLANTRIYMPCFGDLKELTKNKKKRREESAYMNLLQPHKHAEANASIILW